MKTSKILTVTALALMTAACAGPLCQTRGRCRAVISDSSVKGEAVLFAFDSAVLTNAGVKAIDQQLPALTKEGVSNITVYGYTDDMGTEAYNLKLSQKRAEAVKAYLVKKGVKAKTIKTKGMGETNFVAPNDTVQNRSKNRRVEFAVK